MSINPERCARIYGCSVALYDELRGMAAQLRDTPIHKYRAHRDSAKIRGIGFEFSLAEWWAEWDKSGKYSQRGVKKGQYCMARILDEGPYKVGNVVIKTVSANNYEYHHKSKHLLGRSTYPGEGVNDWLGAEKGSLYGGNPLEILERLEDLKMGFDNAENWG